MKGKRLQIPSASRGKKGDKGPPGVRWGRPGGQIKPQEKEEGAYRLNEKVATSASIAISVVTFVPGAGPAGVMNGPLTRFLNTW
jgi:hypothetical protein